MASPNRLEAIGAVCERYGPGRLPLADRSDVGAGYAGATAALASALSFALGALLAEAVGAPVALDGTVLAALGLAAAVLAVPAAFVSAVVVWRLAPSSVPYFGAVAGVVATLATYLLATLALGVLLVVGATRSLTGADPLEAAAFSAAVGYAAFLFSFWVTLPLGCLGGFVYDRVGDPSTG